MSVRAWGEKLLAELGKVVKGQAGTSEMMLVCLLARGHVLLEGVPGLAKTLLAKALAACIGAQYRRVQFTPDLMPSDLTGVRVYHDGQFELQKGPVFTHFLLADEINRTPPKTQSALLQSMEERTVTIDGTDHTLPSPFFVMATQNPVEQEGTYPLPESQLDRFLMKIIIGYPSRDAELEVLHLHHAGMDPHRINGGIVEEVSSLPEVEALMQEIQRVTVDDKVMQYILDIVTATRTSPQIMLGASPRAAVALLACGKTRAALQGREFTIPDDVKDVAFGVLRHRLILRPEAELEGLSADRWLQNQFAALPVPR